MGFFSLVSMESMNSLSNKKLLLSDNEKKVYSGRAFSEPVWLMPGGFNPCDPVESLFHDWPVEHTQVDANEFSVLFGRDGNEKPSSAIFFHCTRYIFLFSETRVASVMYLIFPISFSLEDNVQPYLISSAGHALGLYLSSMSTYPFKNGDVDGVELNIDSIYIADDAGITTDCHVCLRDNIRKGMSLDIDLNNLKDRVNLFPLWGSISKARLSQKIKLAGL